MRHLAHVTPDGDAGDVVHLVRGAVSSNHVVRPGFYGFHVGYVHGALVGDGAPAGGDVAGSSGQSFLVAVADGNCEAAFS